MHCYLANDIEQAAERVKSGKPDDTKQPVLDCRIEELSKWRKLKPALSRTGFFIACDHELVDQRSTE